MDTTERNSWREKAMSKVGSMRNTMSTVRPKATQMWHRVSSKSRDLAHSPVVLGGLAGAAGLTLGLLGRWMRHRAHVPTLVVIETW